MKQVDEADAGQAQVGQCTAADQLIADYSEVLKLMKAPPFGQRPQASPHGRAEVKIAVIDLPGRSGKDAVMRLAVGLNQSIHRSIHSRRKPR